MFVHLNLSLGGCVHSEGGSVKVVYRAAVQKWPGNNNRASFALLPVVASSPHIQQASNIKQKNKMEGGTALVYFDPFLLGLLGRDCIQKVENQEKKY